MKMKMIFVFAIIFIGVSLTFSQQTLNAVKSNTAPTVDGVKDAIWDNATEIIVPLGETNNPPNDPSKINNCAGCHAYDSAVTVELKAVYTTDRFYVLATWPDPTASFTRGGSWSFANGSWEKPNSAQSEDRISFFWPIGDITGNPWNTGGCMSKCHMYYPTDNDPHVSTHAIVDDAWLESGRGDMWHSKAARCGAYLSAVGTGLTIDPATHEVTAGTFSMTGFADDKYVDVWQDDSQNGEDGGRYGDAGTSTYSHNRIGDKSRPKYIEKAPADYADAMFLTQDEIDADECVGDGTTGVSDADAATYWPAYAALNAVVPERILRNAEGSRGDIAFGAVWTDGTWVAELARDLKTGNDDDVQFDTAQDYPFEVAEFDNSRHGYEHRTSDEIILHFDPTEPTVAIEGENSIPESFQLHQNYPNPFNPNTQITFDLSKAQEVYLAVYDILGQEVAVLTNGLLLAGSHVVNWDGISKNGEQMNSGIYLAKLISENYTQSIKMILMK